MKVIRNIGWLGCLHTSWHLYVKSMHFFMVVKASLKSFPYWDSLCSECQRWPWQFHRAYRWEKLGADHSEFHQLSSVLHRWKICGHRWKTSGHRWKLTISKFSSIYTQFNRKFCYNVFWKSIYAIEVSRRSIQVLGLSFCFRVDLYHLVAKFVEDILLHVKKMILLMWEWK